MDIDNEFGETYKTVQLTNDQGEVEDFYVIDAAKFEGFTYVLIVPVEGEADEDEDVFEAVILREVADESDNETVSYDIVTDEEEFERVASFFSESGDFDISVD